MRVNTMGSRYVVTLFLAACLLLGISSCRAESIKLADNIYSIESEVAFRQWNQKGLGDIVKKNQLGVIVTKSRCGDIVILRWNDEHTQFATEVYRAESCSNALSEWKLVFPKGDKTLTDQHGRYFLIVELIPGKDGGQRTERFSLSSKGS